MSRSELKMAPPFAELWAGQDAFIAVDGLKGQVFRELEGRRTLRTEVEGRGYFVKIHRGVGWGEIVKNLFSLRLPVLGARNEFLAIQGLQALGVDTMHAVAYGRRGWNPATELSFIITEELAPTISLEDYCRDWLTQSPAFPLKQALIRRVAEMAKAMHGGGVNHRDFYLCHFLLHLDPEPRHDALKLSVIDLHRAQCRAATPRRWRDKDLASLYFSALEIGLTQRDFLRFLRIYFAMPLRQILQSERPLLDHLAKESQRLQVRYRRKFAHEEAV